jgi:MFS family permease
VVLFLVHGFVVATWISRIPAVQSALRLNNFVLGLTLLASALGALCSIPVTGLLIGRLGSKRVSVLASTIFCVCLLLPSLAVNAVTLAMALYAFGASAAAMDVAMNAQGVEVEKGRCGSGAGGGHANAFRGEWRPECGGGASGRRLVTGYARCA